MLNRLLIVTNCLCTVILRLPLYHWEMAIRPIPIKVSLHHSGMYSVHLLHPLHFNTPLRRLTGMTGSLSNPIPSDTSTHPVPSVAHASSAVVESTSTVGTLSTASGFSTETSPTTAATPTTSVSGSVSGGSANSAAGSLLPSVWISLIGFLLGIIFTYPWPVSVATRVLTSSSRFRFAFHLHHLVFCTYLVRFVFDFRIPLPSH